MIPLIFAAYVLGQLARGVPVEAAAPTPTPHLANVWLDCKWHETWQSSATLGAAHSESTSEHDYDKTYMFSPREEKLFLYDSEDQLLLMQNAVIGASSLMIDDEDKDVNLLGELKSRRQWVISRSDLSVRIFGTSINNTRMDDGRISTSEILMNGKGACVMTEVKPLAPVASNKF